MTKTDAITTLYAARRAADCRAVRDSSVPMAERVAAMRRLRNSPLGREALRNSRKG